MPTILAMIYPPEIEDEILVQASGPQGSLTIWVTPACKEHLHFQYSICGLEAAGTYAYNSAEQSKKEAALDLFGKLNMSIEQTVLEELSEVKHVN